MVTQTRLNFVLYVHCLSCEEVVSIVRVRGGGGGGVVWVRTIGVIGAALYWASSVAATLLRLSHSEDELRSFETSIDTA